MLLFATILSAPNVNAACRKPAERVKEGEPTCEKGAMPPDSAKKGERSKSAKAKSKSPKPKPKPAE